MIYSGSSFEFSKFRTRIKVWIRIQPILFKHHWKTHTLNSIKKNNFPTICHFLFHSSVLQYRAFAGTWSSNQERRGAELHVSLRNNEDLYVPLARTITADRMPVTEFPRAWNNFTEKQIKQEQSTKIFKTKLKNFFMDKLSHIPICSRANCTACH